MKNLLFFLTLLVSSSSIACISATYNGLRINADSAKSCVINQYNFCVQVVDTSSVNVDQVSAEIKNAKLTESVLIARVLAMYTDKNLKLKELVNLSCTQKGIAEI